jgi:hypothetical protein
MRIPRTRAALAAAALVLLGAAAPAGAQSLHGTVVHHNRHGHSFSVATSDGSLEAVHAHRLPGIGRVVSVDARALSNGTFAARSVRAGRRHRHAHLHGTVTFADRGGHRMVVSSNGVSVLLRARASQVPATGTVVDVQAVLPASGMPVAQTVTPVSSDFTVDVEGVVTAIDTTARTLTVSADDDEQSGATLTIAVPATIDLSTIATGQEVELLVALRSDGTFALLGLAGDDNARNADDPGDQQGRPCGGNHDNGEHHGRGDGGGDGGGDNGDGGTDG